MDFFCDTKLRALETGLKGLTTILAASTGSGALFFYPEG